MTDESTGLFYEEFSIGATYTTPARTISQSDVDTFSSISADRNPIHHQPDAMAGHPFERPIVHGMLVVSTGVGLISALGLNHGTLVAMLEQNIRYKKPVYVGDTVHAHMEVIDKRETSHPQRGIVTYRFEIRNHASDVVVEGRNTNMVFRKTPNNTTER
ncbi:MAG: MaoC family dehydratase N-terminal domain-containing protein [Deltaproteobacteria bacterium]|nr:MaoC family dehydratase N-terminal domain-containing protein [Deltaproteobacteria bacterium]MBN2670593.1 MaoC family dehydratase N-terminal domain-containing protein [Deltaproteobacteria bacterium]